MCPALAQSAVTVEGGDTWNEYVLLDLSYQIMASFSVEVCGAREKP